MSSERDNDEPRVRTPELVQTITKEAALAAAKTIKVFLSADRSKPISRLALQRVRQAQRTMKAYVRQERARGRAVRVAVNALVRLTTKASV